MKKISTQNKASGWARLYFIVISKIFCAVAFYALIKGEIREKEGKKRNPAQ